MLSTTPLYIFAAENCASLIKLESQQAESRRKWPMGIKEKPEGSPLLAALINGNEDAAVAFLEISMDIARYSFKNGVNVNIPAEHLNVNISDEYHRTTLMWAVIRGYHKMVKLLLQCNSDIKAEDTYHRNALSYAVEGGEEHILELLIDNGIAINPCDHNGQSPLSFAVLCGRGEVVKLLISKGADVNSKDHLGRTALSFAAERGNADVLEVLLEYGADMDSKDNSGRTPLSYAAEQGHRDILVSLLLKGASREVQDKHGKTPINWAGSDEIVKLLRRTHEEIMSRDALTTISILFPGKEKWVRNLHSLIEKNLEM